MARENHRPKKGDKITVDPIRNPADVEAIKKMLASSPRDSLLFIMGINNGLRAGDLLRLKVVDVLGKKPGDFITVRESKTGKENVLVINKAVHKAMKNFFEALDPAPDDYLFKSRKGANNPITIQAVNNYVKKWCRAINLPGNYGAHSLRKTWGYHQRVYYGAGFEIICKRFNHSSPAVTMRYLGIEDKEVHGILMNDI